MAEKGVESGLAGEGGKESAKKLKTSDEVPEEVKSPDEVPEKKVQEMMQLVPIEEVYIEALQVKHPIIDWKHLDREDLNQLWALVKESLSNRTHTNDKEMELWTLDPLFSSSSKDSPGDRFKPSREEEKKDTKGLRNEEKDISIFKDSNEDVFGVEADLNNMETTFQGSPIPIIRIHKDYLVEQIIGDIHSAPQTKRMTKSVTDHETKKVIQALTDPSWIKAMHDELL
nr:hypothetical protein [Tanacetum cinerariifolium]